MSHRMFDPRNFGQYPVDKAPKMLHFQYKGSSDIFRYICVERIPINEISTASRRKEGEDESIIVERYLKGAGDGQGTGDSTGLQGNIRTGTRKASVKKAKKSINIQPKQRKTKRKD